MPAFSPEDLDTLVEDAVLLGDSAALQGLYDKGAVLVGPGWVGGPARAADLLHSYVAGRVRLVGDVAVSVTEAAVLVSRRTRDGQWQLVASVSRERCGCTRCGQRPPDRVRTADDS